MGSKTFNVFSKACEQLCSFLYRKEYDKAKINILIDELNSQPYKAEFFVRKNDALALITALCDKVRPVDEFLAAKSSHLLNCIITKQNLQFEKDSLWKVILWHIQCLKECSNIILPDILYNMQCILQTNPQAGHKFIDELLGSHGVLTNLIGMDKNHSLSTQNPLQICLTTLKCVCAITAFTEDSKENESQHAQDLSRVKEVICQKVISFLLKGYNKSQDEFVFCKVVITALKILSQIYFSDQNLTFPLPEVVGIARYFVLYGLIDQAARPEKIMPAQQTIAAAPANHNPKGGKKQKLRKHRNNAIDSLKKDIPVSDKSLKDVDHFENSTYRPAITNYLEPERAKHCWALTSDSDLSDLESGREAKLVTLKSRVRQSASNLLLVLVKVKEKHDLCGYFWALLPDSPNVNNWHSEENARKTLAYCAVVDPISTSRASVLSVILALLSGSRMYLAQAEISKKETDSFIPFSVSLGYMITCMHKVLTSILESERNNAVIIVTLKCCAALVQATPYHKMGAGLITDLVMATRKFLVHRDVTLQVGALITMSCILSVDPKVDEVLKSIEKDTAPKVIINIRPKKAVDEDCDDFEEGYSDDEMFAAVDIPCDDKSELSSSPHFKSWILDICFKNMGWTFKENKIVQVKPSAIPVILESLQVLSAIAFHHLHDLLIPHLKLLSDVFPVILQHEHQDVILQATRAISIIGDGLRKLEQTEHSPPLNQCVHLWEKLLSSLSAVLQSHENPPAKAVVCDCLANIGERSYKELPRRLQVMCCALLVGSCGDEEARVRAAAVRALAMAIMYRTLREDICFVSDCGENILRALAEPTLVVRVKAAWALGNLSDALVLNNLDPEIDDIDDILLVRLLEVSIHCANDNYQVKVSATRSLGNLLRLIKDDTLERNPQIKALCENAIEKLLECACKATNMKVRWNACHAIGNAMRNEYLFSCFSGWQMQVFSKLCTLTRESKNLKVRINAASALRTPATRQQYGEHFPSVWAGLMQAMETAANVDDFSEYKHKDNLIEQLCVTLSHMCSLLNQSDLTDILDPLVFHYDRAKSLFSNLSHKLPPENVSCLIVLQAAKHVTVDLTASNENQSQALTMLQDIFVWDV